MVIPQYSKNQTKNRGRKPNKLSCSCLSQDTAGNATEWSTNGHVLIHALETTMMTRTTRTTMTRTMTDNDDGDEGERDYAELSTPGDDYENDGENDDDNDTSDVAMHATKTARTTMTTRRAGEDDDV